MINHKKYAMQTFYDIHEIPAQRMIPPTISIPLVNRTYELITQEWNVENTVRRIHRDLVQVFGKFDVMTVAHMIYEIAQKIGYDISDDEAERARWITSEEANHRREMEALSARRADEERRGFRTAYISNR